MDSKFSPQLFFESESVNDIFNPQDSIYDPLKKIPEIISAIVEKRGDELTQIKKNVWVGKNVKIDETARILGPAIIDDNSSIGFCAYLRENIILFKGVVIGHSSEIKNSIIFEDSAVPHFNYVGDSIVGANVNFGSGAKIANWRFDEKKIKIKIEEEIVDTGLVKFGAVVGDGTKIGINVAINPGTVLGKKVRIFPLVSVFGFWKNDSIVK
ncbi:MAG: hypothetical protein COU27_00490 [Candidatus Levybacteria bacterium CG10_big_fil_rev_8_21_14_0_10_36_7]|nr:MAG: hypothetical protein COU27_00490 [Candidatus Levybacteria bacterium CG10_big_fil_rev_8_21_14_0_10_36_7]